MNIHGWNLFAFLLNYVFTYGVMNPGSCNFNSNLCGWTQDPYYRCSWGTDNGQNVYLCLKSDDGRTHRALLESFPVEARGAQCLTFEYKTKNNYQSSGYSGTLNVSLVNNDFEYHLVQVKEGNYDNVWQTLSLNVVNGQNSMYVKIRFSASVARRDDMYLDNIQLLKGSCRFECNFEENLCGATIQSFERIYYNDFIDTWSDHTSKRAGGHYLNLEGRNTYAALDNINFLLYDIQCLTFWYRISGYTSTVRVTVEDTAKKAPLCMWEMSGGLNSPWLPATITVEVFGRTMVKFRISGILGMYQGRIGLDDIAITSGSCLESTTIRVPVSTFTTKYNDSYTSIRTTSARKSTSTRVSTAAATNITTTASSTETTNRTNEHEWENGGLQIKEEESRGQVSVGGIIGIIIGCIVISGAASLVAVYVYRRRQAFATRTKTPRKSTLTNRTCSGMLKIENKDKSVTSSVEKDEKRNPTSESVYYNVQAEYTTVEKKQMRQNHNQHISGSDDVSVYSLPGSLPDNDCSYILHAAEIDGLNHEDVNIENNYDYYTMYEPRKTMSDSTYNHTNEFHDDAYASTIPSAIRPMDETYSQLECKSTLDNIYSNTSIINESTHNTYIKSSDQDHTYNNTCTVFDDDDCTITHTTIKDADNIHDHTF